MLYAIVAVLVLIADQALKCWTTNNIPLGETVPLIPGVVHLTYVQNFGGAFGILEGFRWFFLLVTALFLVIAIYALVKQKINGSFGRWTAALVVAGASGNAIDRAIDGYVVDMIEVEFIRFQVFNIADCFITVCGILFCLYILVNRDPLIFSARNKPAPRRTQRTDAPERRDIAGGGDDGPDARHDAELGKVERITVPWVDPFADDAPPAAPVAATKETPVPAQPAASPPPTTPAAVHKEPAPGKEPPATDDEFSLESILAEFGEE